MNIFVLSEDPVEAAEMQCNAHVVKMILETAQLLCFQYEPGEAPYVRSRSHYNHPCSIWARQSRENYHWLCIHGLALCEEHLYRYGTKIHSSQKIIESCLENSHRLQFPQTGLTEFAVAINEHQECRKLKDFENMSVVEQYRNYYLHDKKEFAVWKTRSPPSWWEVIA